MIETQVMERKEAEGKFEDAVALGQTVVMANLPKVDQKFEAGVVTIKLGNFPPKSILSLTA